jgi:hypothetical protein
MCASNIKKEITMKTKTKSRGQANRRRTRRLKKVRKHFFAESTDEQWMKEVQTRGW